MQPHDTFTGSYQPGDVEFLLKPVVIEMTPVELELSNQVQRFFEVNFIRCFPT